MPFVIDERRRWSSFFQLFGEPPLDCRELALAIDSRRAHRAVQVAADLRFVPAGIRCRVKQHHAIRAVRNPFDPGRVGDLDCSTFGTATTIIPAVAYSP